MDRIYAKALRAHISAQREQMRQKAAELLTMLADEKSGDFESNKSQILSRLDEMLAESDRKLERFNVPVGGWDFGAEKGRDVFVEDATLRLSPFSNGDERLYCEIRESYRIFEKDISEDKLIASYWSETQCDSVFYCMVERSSDFQKIGYIALKDTTKDVWEVAIELLPDFCGHGYGPAAILLFLNRIRDITGKRQYNFLVEVDNNPCQRCMEGIQAKLVGIVNLVFDDREQAERFEEENLDMITKHLEDLAAELGVEPRKLLSHVLDYRLDI